MSVRLTTDAKFLARWILGHDLRITPETIRQEAEGKACVGPKHQAILLNALRRAGEEGVRALSDFDPPDWEET